MPAFLKRHVGVEAAQPGEERLVAHQPPQHVQHHRALVVDERAEDPAVRLDVAEAIAEIDRALRRHVDGPSPHLPQHGRERLGAALALGVERGEVLREALAEPLLVIVLPADRLAPPLVRELVREEERRKPSNATGSLRQMNGVVGSGWLRIAKYAGLWPPGSSLSTSASVKRRTARRR